MRLPTYQQLSREQDEVNSLPIDGSYLVTGPPGTGKTVMALYRAKMLSDQDKTTQLLMRSRLLSQYTREHVEALAIDGAVNTFDSWLPSFYRRFFSRQIPAIDDYVYDWPAILTAFGRKPPAKGQLPYLLVDEGQDIDKNFYPIARYLARYLTVFADENQRLTANNSTIKEIKAYGQFDQVASLTKNYRNTKEIAALAAHFYTGLATGIPREPEESGPTPELRAFKSLHETAQFISRYELNNPDASIGVLVWKKKTRDSIYNRLCVDGRTRNTPQVYDGGRGRDADVVDFSRPGVTVLCYQSAKGLEFDTVFLPELQTLTHDINSPEFRMLFYVMISRAREMLYLAYSGEERPAVANAFPSHLVDFKK
jgi:superfamily I DNA/RNA helicase